MSAVRPAKFTGLDAYKLTGVRVTDRELGHGSYATVLEMEYMGLKCAGKKVHELLLRQGDASYTVRRFEEECHLLSQLRHPNIVQFLGVYFQRRVRTPILVMEFLPTNLTSCIEQYGTLPKEISYSILHDVALGLCYLHSQIPPIIDRDLSSNNVLLTPSMTAKISDLGVARILSLTPLQVSRMTQTPGTPAYMPPEVMIANPKYDTSVDEFSYGIMMIHMFSGQWPEPQVGPNRTEPDGRLIPVTEAKRREVFLHVVGSDHPLMDLILKCIHNHPRARAHASEIVERLAKMVLQFPASFANRLELLRQIEAVKEEKKALAEEGERKDRAILQKESQFSSLRENVDQLKLAHASEVEQLRLQVRDLITKKQLITAKMEAEVAELKSNTAVYKSQIKTNLRTQFQERELFKHVIAEQTEQSQLQLAQQKQQLELQLAHERETNQNLQSDLLKVRSENTNLLCTISELQADTAEKGSAIKMKDTAAKRKDSELEAKSRALEEKDAAISAMSEQITKIREFLATKQQVLQASITWKQCANLPTELSSGVTTVINGKIYCGGVTQSGDDGDYTIFCYDPSQGRHWTTLPPLPVRYFGLGQVNGKLVAVGGVKKTDEEATNKVHTYDERSRKWKQTIPPMPTARDSPGVLSLQSALAVAGGNTPSHVFYYTAAVEIFKPDISQWYRTTPLPTACRDVSLVAIGNACYALGGYDDSYLNQALYTSVDDLLGNAVPTNQTTHSGSSDTKSAWKTLPDIPTYRPAAAVLSGKLIAIGGEETSEGGTDMKQVYMYSPSTNSWIYISDLPAPRSITAAAVLSSTEVLVIGGWDMCSVNTVYKGTLHL